MVSNPPCTCGRLARWALDPELPIFGNPATQFYSLHLGPDASLGNIKCPCCGGWPNGERHPVQGVPNCRCGVIERWASDPSLPVRYGNVCRELYEIGRLDVGKIIAVWYCPACGGRMSDGMAAAENADQTPEPAPPRFRFTIRSLLILTTIAALAFGWWADQYRLARRLQRLADTIPILSEINQGIITGPSTTP